MNKRIIVSTVLVLLFLATMIVASEKAWLDMENCDMCKAYTKHAGLMENMNWEQLKISNGIMSLCMVGDEQMEAYTAAGAECTALGEKLMAGEEVSLCGSCTSLNGMLGKGAAMEKIALKNGGVMLFTSADEAMVAELHAWTDHNLKAYAEMMKAPEEAEAAPEATETEAAPE